MRFALVILFFAALSFGLRSTPPVQVPSRTALAPSSLSEQKPPSKPAAEAPAPAAPESVEGTTSAANDPRALDSPLSEDAAGPQTNAQSGDTLDKPGEERTSSHASAKPDPLDQNIEAKIQKELTRLGCYAGKAENGWGRKSRTAMRRFAVRAKLKGGSTPTQVLLNSLRSYPASYCKLCRPGQKACDIGGPRKKSDSNGPLDGSDPSLAYLPPWMLEEKPARSAEAVTLKPARQLSQRKTARKGTSARAAFPRARRAVADATPPSRVGWPGTYEPR